MIPAALSGIVGGFRGLHDFLPHPMLRKHPDYTVTINNASDHFLAPGDIATIYDINPLYQQTPAIDGTGQSVVIAAQTDVYLADLNDFRSAFGLSAISGCTMDSTNTIIQAGNCSSGNFEMVVPTGTGLGDPGVSPGDLGESDLDIEWLGSVARGAKIIFVTSSGGVDISAAYAIDNTLAHVISYSYGLCEAFDTAPNIATSEGVYEQASAEGIAFFAASGDNGAAECDGDNGSYPAVLGPSVSYPASSPEVTGVGGTEFNEGTGNYWDPTNGSDGGSATGYIPELGWNDTTLAKTFDATGGGASNCAFGPNGDTTTVGGYPFQICNAPTSGGFPKPTWQSSVTPADSVRDVPDISFSASNANDAYIVCTPQSEVVQNSTSSTSTCVNGITDALTDFDPPSAFGGTSASTPVAAGMAVLLNQYLNTTVGPINSYMYTTVYANSPTVFHDIVGGTSSTGTGDTSDNIEPCTPGNPTFEPSALQCPSAADFGFTAGTGYDQVTGLGSIDINKFFQAWAASAITFSTSATALSPASVSAGTTTTSTVTITPLNTASGIATYTFTCSDLPIGVGCSFNPASVTGTGASVPSTVMTVTTAASMAAGNYSITVNGISGTVSESITTPLSLAVTTTNQSFTIAPQNGTYQVIQGQSVNATIVLTPTNGFVTPVTFTCSDSASESTCNGPTGPTTSLSVNFAVTTTLATSELRRPADRGVKIFYAALLPGLLGIVFTLGSRKRSTRGMRVLGLIMVLGFSTVWLGSCGGTSGTTIKNPGTPKGNYTITINATTGGSSPITGTTTFTLTVQ
jgi:subtilase family serine protease